MSEIPLLNIPYEELKNVVIESIKNFGSSFEFKNLCNTGGAIAVKKGIVANPNPTGFQAIYFPIQQKDANTVREIVWDLIMERVVTIGDFHNDSWPWLSLTEYGKAVLNSENPIPHDPSGYLKRVKEQIPLIDHIIERYLIESINTYNINQLLSSTITLGCASEKALMVLIDSFALTFKEENKKLSFLKKIEGRFIKTQFDEFDKAIRLILTSLPYELKENYSNTLTGVFQMIRYNRNNAGHPTGKAIDKDTLFANLQVFVPYCKYIYDLKSYFETHVHD